MAIRVLFRFHLGLPFRQASDEEKQKAIELLGAVRVSFLLPEVWGRAICAGWGRLGRRRSVHLRRTPGGCGHEPAAVPPDADHSED